MCVGQHVATPHDGGSALIDPIPDADWPHVLAAFIDVARKHGFTTVRLSIDRPGRHEITLADQYGATVELATITGTSLGVSGACFLDATHHPQPPGAT